MSALPLNIRSLPEEVARFALEATRVSYPDVSCRARIVLARRLTVADAAALGLGGGDPATADAPMVLVALRGNFDVSRFPGRGKLVGAAPRAAFMTYVFDLRSGTSFHTVASRDEAAFLSLGLARAGGTHRRQLGLVASGPPLRWRPRRRMPPSRSLRGPLRT